jgi:hypothetical protein
MLWFVQGDGFNAKDEAEQLFRNFARSRKPDQVRAAVGMHSSIQLAVLTGFADVAHAWTKWNDRNPLFTYADSGVVGAVKVAGDGRSNSRDLTFVGTKHYFDVNLVVIQSIDLFMPNFLREMEQRLKSCRVVEWP